MPSFGNQTCGTPPLGFNAKNKIVGEDFICPEDALATQITAQIYNGYSPPADVGKAAIYNGNTLVGVSEEVPTPHVTGPVIFPFTNPILLQQGVTYRPVIWFGPPDALLNVRTWTGTTTNMYYQGTSYTGIFPDPASFTATGLTRSMCIWCNYIVPPCSSHQNQTDCEAAGCIWWGNHCHEELPGLCTWVALHGGPTGLTIPSIFNLIDCYLNQTQPPGPPGEPPYGFIPTLSNVFGVIDYYLGFIESGNMETGCSFPTI